jgi:hypothetical protein
MAAHKTAEAQVTTDHDEIRKWAEARGGKPAAVRTTLGRLSAGSTRWCLFRRSTTGSSGSIRRSSICVIFARAASASRRLLAGMPSVDAFEMEHSAHESLHVFH